MQPDRRLQYLESVHLPGNPFDVVAQEYSHENDRITRRIIISVDGVEEEASTSSGLTDGSSPSRVLSLMWQDGSLVVDPTFQLQDVDDANEPDVSGAEVRQLFYSTAILRKQTGGGEAKAVSN